MSGRFTSLLLGLSLLLNCFVLAGFVYSTWIVPPEHRFGPPPGGPGGPPRSPLEALTQDLKLDDKQRDAVRGTLDQYAKNRHERFLEIGKLREQLVAELKKPDFDLARINDLVDQATKLRGELQKENLASIAQIAPQLTPEQRDRLHTLLADRYGGSFRGPQGRGPGPGGPGRPPQ
ncbi:MAG: periplasmic heavy metal sensor [Alphaproteobacteria bacterium]|nr:periplasmic heavy metal sensor [Alphaproteobacteria bacterium]